MFIVGAVFACKIRCTILTKLLNVYVVYWCNLFSNAVHVFSNQYVHLLRRVCHWGERTQLHQLRAERKNLGLGGNHRCFSLSLQKCQLCRLYFFKETNNHVDMVLSSFLLKNMHFVYSVQIDLQNRVF